VLFSTIFSPFCSNIFNKKFISPYILQIISRNADSTVRTRLHAYSERIGKPIGTRIGTRIGTPIGTRIGTRIGTPIGTRIGTRIGTPIVQLMAHL
jgi:tetrahydromethanopterin S-methyltransferase subunit G